MLRRVRRANENRAASAMEVDRARAERDVALAQIARIKAIIARKTLRAPFPARVGLADVHPGQYLNEGTQITTLQGVDDAAHVDFTVAQPVAASLRVGGSVDVFTISDSSPSGARIVAIDARIEPTTRNATVRLKLDHDSPAALAEVTDRPSGRPDRLAVSRVRDHAGGRGRRLGHRRHHALAGHELALCAGPRHRGPADRPGQWRLRTGAPGVRVAARRGGRGEPDAARADRVRRPALSGPRGRLCGGTGTTLSIIGDSSLFTWGWSMFRYRGAMGPRPTSGDEAGVQILHTCSIADRPSAHAWTPCRFASPDRLLQFHLYKEFGCCRLLAPAMHL